MTKKEARGLKIGLYTIYWKEGGRSLAAIGQIENGDKWLAPTNWLHPTEKQEAWRTILRVEKI